MPECLICGRRKKPYGRDAGAAAANGYCGYDCEGYNQEPKAGHFWPEERDEPDADRPYDDDLLGRDRPTSNRLYRLHDWNCGTDRVPERETESDQVAEEK
jgi:hypothetical protein